MREPPAKSACKRISWGREPTLNENEECINLTLPLRPLAICSKIHIVCGWIRYMKASINDMLLSRDACTIVTPCSAVTARGFSHDTCLPACSDLLVHSACRVFGTGM